MSTEKEKLAVAVLALVFAAAGGLLIGVGSFLPHWAAVRNVSVAGNVSFSLWTRRECFGELCTVEYVTKEWFREECIRGRVPRRCTVMNGTEVEAQRRCRPVEFCNSTWVAGFDMDNTPSMLIAAKAFETPAIFFALLCLVLYVIKIVLLVKKPVVKRNHLKAAYLTFGAIAGTVAIIGVILFCTMLEGEKYDRQWAPFVNLAGGIVFFLFGFGGYLRWRDRTADSDFEDDMSLYEGRGHEVRAKESAVHRQISETSAKAAEAKV